MSSQIPNVNSRVTSHHLTCEEPSTHVLGAINSRVRSYQLTCEEPSPDVCATRELTLYMVFHFVTSEGLRLCFRSASATPLHIQYAPLARYESLLVAVYFKDKTKTETSKAWRFV